jgi:hypothetical protein
MEDGEIDCHRRKTVLPQQGTQNIGEITWNHPNVWNVDPRQEAITWNDPSVCNGNHRQGSAILKYRCSENCNRDLLEVHETSEHVVRDRDWELFFNDGTFFRIIVG